MTTDRPDFGFVTEGNMAPAAPLLYDLARYIDPERMVELGVRTGNSTRTLLLATDDAHLTSIDIEACPDANAHVEGLGETGRWRFTMGDSRKVAERWTDPIDLLYVDTDHTYDTTLAELRGFAPHVTPGGAVALHDTLPTHDGRWDVLGAVRTFLGEHDGWTFEEYNAGEWGFGVLWPPDAARLTLHP